MVCAINYVWSALLCLFFLFVYCKVKHAQNIHWPATIFLFLFSIITSWTHEALVIGISGALFLNYCLHYKKQKTKKAEISMMPSRPRLITPECSEKQPPRATRISTEAKIRVYCSSKLMPDRLLSRWPHLVPRQPWPSEPPFPPVWQWSCSSHAS